MTNVSPIRGDVALILRPIDPAHLHDVWDDVGPDLDRCRLHDVNSPWLEDIYHAIRSGMATLYTGMANEEYAGCVLLQFIKETWTGKPRLHIWMCCNHGDHDLLKEVQAQIDQIARASGAQTITFRSDKLSFERLCRDLGYRLREVELVRELDHG